MLDEIIKSDGDCIIVKIIITPNAKKDEITGLDNWRAALNVKIKEKPLQNKANKSLIRFFADTLHLKPADVDIIKGSMSREKTLKARIRKSEAIKILEETLDI